MTYHRGDSGQIKTCKSNTNAGIPACGKYYYKRSRCNKLTVIDTHTAQHESPVETSNIDVSRVRYGIESQVGHESKHDPEGSPCLPHHDESTTDCWGCTFGRIYRHGGALGTNTQTKKEPSDKQVLPAVGNTLPDTG